MRHVNPSVVSKLMENVLGGDEGPQVAAEGVVFRVGVLLQRGNGEPSALSARVRVQHTAEERALKGALGDDAAAIDVKAGLRSQLLLRRREGERARLGPHRGHSASRGHRLGLFGIASPRARRCALADSVRRVSLIEMADAQSRGEGRRGVLNVTAVKLQGRVARRTSAGIDVLADMGHLGRGHLDLLDELPHRRTLGPRHGGSGEKP